MKRRFLPWLVILLCWASLGFAQDNASRPSQWAQPINTSALKNFYKVDDHLYRSSQPDEAGMKALEQMGIRHILNLRQFHSDDDEAEDTHLRLHRVAMNAGKIKDEDIIAALAMIKNANGPVLVHCWHGSDRTGTIVAMYRIIFQNWPKQKALDELVNGGYGYHSIYANIPEYIESVDVEHIRQGIGLATKPKVVESKK